MRKERVERINNVEQSFGNLNFGKIEQGSEGERAILDAIEIGREREENFFRNFNMEMMYGVNCEFLQPTLGSMMAKEVRQQNQQLNDKIKSKLLENNGKNEYTIVFGKTVGWLSDGFLGDEPITCGTKLRYVCQKFGVPDDVQPDDGSGFKIRDLFKRNKI